MCVCSMHTEQTTKHTNNTKPNYQTQNMQTTKSQHYTFLTSSLLPDDPPDAPEEKEITKRKTYISNK